MSVEAMWMVEFAAHPGGEYNLGAGTVVLEANRLFGGDSSMYYIGKYTVSRPNIEFVVSVNRYNAALPSVFGPTHPNSYRLIGKGKISDDDRLIEFLAYMQHDELQMLNGRLYGSLNCHSRCSRSLVQ